METCFTKSFLFKTVERKLVLSCDDGIKPNNYDLPVGTQDILIAEVLSVVSDSSTKVLVRLLSCTDLEIGDRVRISAGVAWPEISGQIKRLHKNSNLILLEV